MRWLYVLEYITFSPNYFLLEFSPSYYYSELSNDISWIKILALFILTWLYNLHLSSGPLKSIHQDRIKCVRDKLKEGAEEGRKVLRLWCRSYTHWRREGRKDWDRKRHWHSSENVLARPLGSPQAVSHWRILYLTRMVLT